MRAGRPDINPAAFSSLASSYSGNDSITTGIQEVTGISVPISMRVFWSMSGTVNVFVYVNGVVVAHTGTAISGGALDITLEAGDEFFVYMLRNTPRTGYLQLVNLSAGYVQLALISVTIT